MSDFPNSGNYVNVFILFQQRVESYRGYRRNSASYKMRICQQSGQPPAKTQELRQREEKVGQREAPRYRHVEGGGSLCMLSRLASWYWLYLRFWFYQKDTIIYSSHAHKPCILERNLS